MYQNSLEVKLTPRTKVKTYNVKLNPATLEILTLLFEFKLAGSWHITRFLKQKDTSRHIYANYKLPKKPLNPWWNQKHPGWAAYHANKKKE